METRGVYLNEQLINQFRERINRHYFVLHKYKNVEGKNKWNCICSAMDWISVSIHYLCSDRVLKITKDENMNSIEVYTFISCIDILWESIQQLHRVFYDTTEILFSGERRFFINNQFGMADNDYFKTIRACFGAHPVNLKDKFNGKTEERRFASWSGAFGSKDSFSVMLYSSDISDQKLRLDINFQELWEFAEHRYNYLEHLMGLIERQEKSNIREEKERTIAKVEDPLDQIAILSKEVVRRSESDYYEEILCKLKILFSANINGEKNLNIVNQYRNLLLFELEEVFNNVQNMNFVELEWEEKLSGTMPWKYHYSYAKVCDYIFDGVT